jgi:hypothetical protein
MNPELWQPFAGGLQMDSAAEIAGEAAVAEYAYRVHYSLETAPEATLTIWAYAVTAHPDESSPGPYAVGYRGECWLGETLQDAWNEQGWEAYDSPGAADRAARALAGDDTQMLNRGASEDLPFFEWDGGAV